MSEENRMCLEINGDTLHLNGQKLSGVENYKIELSSDFPGKGKAELSLKMIVNFSDNMHAALRRGVKMSAGGKKD